MSCNILTRKRHKTWAGIRQKLAETNKQHSSSENMIVVRRKSKTKSNQLQIKQRKILKITRLDKLTINTENTPKPHLTKSQQALQVFENHRFFWAA